jgi:hypothetical protein
LRHFLFSESTQFAEQPLWTVLSRTPLMMTNVVHKL